MCEANSSVSSCAFDDGTTWLQQALTFGILNNEEGGAVLDGTSRILELCFSEDIATGLFGELLETDERSLANCWVRSESIPPSE